MTDPDRAPEELREPDHPSFRSRGAAVRDMMGLTRGLVSAWPTLLTFFAGLLATLGVWMLAETYPRSERNRTQLATANGMRQVLEVRLNDHLRGLELIRDLWTRFPSHEPAEWKARAQVFLQQHPALAMVAMVPDAPTSLGATAGASPSADLALFDDGPAGRESTELVARAPGVSEWKVGRELSERLREARRRAVDDQRASLDGPYLAESGQGFYQVVVPLQDQDRPAGMLCALLQPAPLMATLIREAAPDYFLTVHDGATQVYAQGVPPRAADGEPQDPNERIELPIRLLMGSTWTLGLVRSDLFDMPSSLSLGKLVLAIGLVFSVLLAGVVHLGQVARVRARALAIANRELRSQIVSTAVAEGRVRRVNESLEARVAERTRALDEVVNELETFNYSVSHDLRSPIGAIVNFTSILTEDYKDKLDAQGVDILRRVAGCAQNAVTMMDGLLTFSHIGQQSLTPGPVEMRPLVESVYAEVALAHDGRAPAFSVGALPTVTADATMMRTVWTNLLSNAVKFTASSPEAAIEVGSQPAPEEDVFFVRDNGVGFEMKHATRLFNVFEQLHPTPQSKGRGVGLAIVSRIVRRHGGRVWAQAAPGKGATFYFSIPKVAA